MFVFSMKTTRVKILGSVLLVAVLLVLAVLSRSQAVPSGTTPVAADDAARRAVLSSLGYEVLPEHTEVREILIPAAADEAFTAYNELQKAAGYDLTEYSGRRVKCWTYTVTNYPGEESVEAHLYMYKDKVIGGDISSTAQDGFSHGLTAPATA